MTKIYRSHLLASVHETAHGLNQAGILSNPDMQMFNVLSLMDEPLQTTPIKKRKFEQRLIRVKNLLVQISALIMYYIRGSGC
jgi:hypothetical protein